MLRESDVDCTSDSRRYVDVKQDAGSPALTSESEMMIEVSDENDCRPLFTSDDYTVTVTENSASGLSVYQLSAVDADLPGSANSRLAYNVRPTTNGERPAITVDPVCFITVSGLWHGVDDFVLDTIIKARTERCN